MSYPPDPVEMRGAATRVLKELGGIVGHLERLVTERAAEAEAARRRAGEAEQRATLYEQRADENQNKADRTDELEQACEKLLIAMDRLPLKMEDAGIIPGNPSSDIALYQTYDWQAVMDAKLALKEAMKRS